MEFVIETERIIAKKDDVILGNLYFSEAGNIDIIESIVVSKNYQGQGIGKNLIKVMIERNSKLERKINPLCPFARAYFYKHPEYQNLVN